VASAASSRRPRERVDTSQRYGRAATRQLALGDGLVEPL
jgi:hypothetical protein